MLVPLAMLAAARVLRVDGSVVVTAATGLSVWVFLPAYPVLSAAIATRRRALAAVAGAVVGAHVVWTLPLLASARDQPALGADAARIRLLTANVYGANRHVEALYAELADAGADVVLLQEVTPAHAAALETTALWRDHPYRVVDAREDAFGSAILSRLPLEGAEPWMVGPLPMTRARVSVAGQRIRLLNVHTRGPFDRGGRRIWGEQLALLTAAARDAPRPLIVAGDFNATPHHRQLRAMLDEGLRDAHRERGRAWVTTWPTTLPLLPPLMLLDRVLVSDGIAVLGVRELTGRGSDHRPVVADLALAP